MTDMKGKSTLKEKLENAKIKIQEVVYDNYYIITAAGIIVTVAGCGYLMHKDYRRYLMACHNSYELYLQELAKYGGAILNKKLGE